MVDLHLTWLSDLGVKKVLSTHYKLCEVTLLVLTVEGFTVCKNSCRPVVHSGKPHGPVLSNHVARCEKVGTTVT